MRDNTMRGRRRTLVLSAAVLALAAVLMGSLATTAGAASVGAAFEVSGDQVVGSPVSFSDRSTGEPKWVYWNFGDGRSSREMNTTHAFMVSGNYDVRYTVCAASNDCDTTIRTISVARPAADQTPGDPVARFTTSGAMVAGSPVTFTDRSTGQIGWVYWNFGDGSSSRTKSVVTHTFAEPGTYNVRYSVCVAADRCDLQIQPVQIGAATSGSGTPLADFRYSLVEGDVDGTSLQFEDRSTGNVRWVYWNFGDGSSSRERSPSHTYGAAGRYQVRFSVCATSARCDTETRWIETGSGDGTPTAPPSDSGTSTVLDTQRDTFLASSAWSPDGSLFVTQGFDGRDHEIQVWRMDDLTSPAFRFTTGDVRTRDLSWSPDSRRLARVDGDGSVRIWSLDDPANATLVGQQEEVRTVTWSPDGTTLVTAGEPFSVNPRGAQVWDLSRPGSPEAFLPHSTFVSWAKWSRDGSKLLTRGGHGDVRVWSSGDWSAPIATMKDEATIIYDAELSPDATRVVSRSSDHVVRVWDVATPATPVELRGHVNVVRSVEWSPDGSQVVSASRDGTVRVWDPADPANPLVLQGHTESVGVGTWSPDGSVLATGGDDGTVRLWSLDQPDDPTVLTAHTSPVSDVRWSPDGSRLSTFSPSDDTVRIWTVD